ncbi:glycosyltransferase family 2 protein [Aestuariicella hydrocarbonica]|uniref:Glycosyltransferase family 2 protein n=1 Tax=Pseudomaricurvus hydrocarbonicus TaxID=1470433 RepID=A0A9E5JT58_9GAMM|nr:glycosyltransferase family 2 protein [Aestuariicella hydrocarbonica]NHO65098.1 glycosyltransferase family 2 protein [Aestuariicella hydrocarbonica]
MSISIVIPAKDESAVIKEVVLEIKKLFVGAELIVVCDGSSDDTASLAEDAGAKVIRKPYSMGNGAAIKTGFRAASGDIVVFMDGDGQHSPSDISSLLEKLDEGFDMVVGARGRDGQANAGRGAANKFYNTLASYITGQNVEDLTSGFRAVRASKFREFLSLLPNGFSYPTTSTMAFFRAGYPVAYVPILVKKRIGKSHINLVRDGIRFLLIIFKVGTLYSPLKMFVPLSFIVFILGLIRYFYTFSVSGEFTNMSAILFVSSLLIFLMGLISEQISSLVYQLSTFKKNDE